MVFPTCLLGNKPGFKLIKPCLSSSKCKVGHLLTAKMKRTHCSRAERERKCHRGGVYVFEMCVERSLVRDGWRVHHTSAEALDFRERRSRSRHVHSEAEETAQWRAGGWQCATGALLTEHTVITAWRPVWGCYFCKSTTLTRLQCQCVGEIWMSI